MFGLDEVRGGSGWGAGTFAGPTGARQPTQTELSQAEHQVKKPLFRHRMSLEFGFDTLHNWTSARRQPLLAVDAAALRETQQYCKLV